MRAFFVVTAVTTVSETNPMLVLARSDDASDASGIWAEVTR